MEPHRIAVKLYLENPEGIDPEELVPVFHRFIREDLVGGIPIDVARYGHVSDGPGIMIIGHQLDHALDLGDGRAGLSTTRKRDADAGTHRWTHTAGTPVHAHGCLCILRQCVPSNQPAPSSFSSASPTGETAESSADAASFTPAAWHVR